RHPCSHTQRKQCSEQNQHRQEQDLHCQSGAVIEHQEKKQRKRKNKVDQARQHCRSGNDQTWKVNLRDQVCAADETVAAGSDRVGKESPRNETGERKKWIRNSRRRNTREPAKEDRKDDHHEQRLENGPRSAERSLLVAHFDVAPGQKKEQLTIGPNVFEAEKAPFFAWLNDD